MANFEPYHICSTMPVLTGAKQVVNSSRLVQTGYGWPKRCRQFHLLSDFLPLEVLAQVMCTSLSQLSSLRQQILCAQIEVPNAWIWLRYPQCTNDRKFIHIHQCKPLLRTCCGASDLFKFWQILSINVHVAQYLNKQRQNGLWFRVDWCKLDMDGQKYSDMFISYCIFGPLKY